MWKIVPKKLFLSFVYNESDECKCNSIIIVILYQTKYVASALRRRKHFFEVIKFFKIIILENSNNLILRWAQKQTFLVSRLQLTYNAIDNEWVDMNYRISVDCRH